MTRFVVIVPVWNPTPDHAAMTNATLQRIRAVSPAALIVAIDNGSAYPADPALSHTGRNWATNRGIAAAFNAGMEAAFSGKTYELVTIFAFVNTDVTVHPGWDTALTAAALDGPTIAFVDTPEGHPTGWCFAVSAETARRIGPFDVAFGPCGYEDTDWFERATREHGVRLVVTAAKADHLGGASVKALDRSSLIWWSNRLRWAWKWGYDPNDMPTFWRAPLPRWALSSGVSGE